MTLSPEEIDRLVVAQADDDSAWEKPVRVEQVRGRKLRLQDLPRKVTRANLHREVSVGPPVARKAL